MVAHELLAGFVPLRKKGKLPFTTVSLAYSLDAFALLALAQGQPERAQILLSASDAYRQSIHTDLLPPERSEREKLLDAVNSALPIETISSLAGRGRGMSHDEAVDFALS